MQIFLFLALIIAIIAVIFAVQNPAVVTLTFLAWKIEQPLAVVLLVTLAVGALISFFFSLPANIRTRIGLRQQKKRMTELETQLTESHTQLTKLQDELVALKAPARSEPAPTPTTSSSGSSVTVSAAKTIASFIKPFLPNTQTKLSGSAAPAAAETPAQAVPPAAEPIVSEPTATKPTSPEPSPVEPPTAEKGETTPTEENTSV